VQQHGQAGAAHHPIGDAAQQQSDQAENATGCATIRPLHLSAGYLLSWDQPETFVDGVLASLLMAGLIYFLLRAFR
jgi:hypothetical protein